MIEDYINKYDHFRDDDNLWATVRFKTITSCGDQRKRNTPTLSERWGSYEHTYVVEVFAKECCKLFSSGEIILPLDVTDDEVMQCIFYKIDLYEGNSRFSPPSVVLELFPYSNKYPTWHKPYFDERRQDWVINRRASI